MPSMIKTNCKYCGAEFEARIADIKRGWGKYCSKSCKAKKQEARTGQHRRHLENFDDIDDNWGHPFASGYEGHGQD